MGCRICKNSSKHEPAVQHIEKNKRSIKYENHDHNDNIRFQESDRTRKPLPEDDIIIVTVPGQSHHIEIQVADPQAFNKALIRQRQQAIDNRSYRSNIESWRPNSLQQLAETIKVFLDGKPLVDCHWIIFYWIACNIEYDTVLYFSGNYGNQSADAVFRTGKGVCAGYANLYKYLCDQLQMPCEIVGGYSKGYGFDRRIDAPTKTDHAWNAVEIDRHWYLMESTWGAGRLNEQKAFKHKLNSYYFLPRPNEMIYHHLPEDEKWQLLRTPVTRAQYLQMPQIDLPYFELNLQLVSPLDQAHVDLLPNKSYALVMMRAPSDVHIMADLKLNDQKIDGGHQVIFDDQNQVYCCYFAPAHIGEHNITIYGKPGDTETDTENGSYRAALTLTLDVKQMPLNPVSFPESWKNFFDLGLKIISPRNTHIIKINKGTTDTEIRITTPDSVELLGCLRNESGQEVKGGHQVYYERRTNIWRCKFAPDRDGIFEALIMAKRKSDSGDYTSAVSFRIEAKHIPLPPSSYPKTWQLFHDLDMKVETPRDRATIRLQSNQYEAEVHLQTPDSVQLIGRLTNSNEERIEDGYQVFYDQRSQLWICKFAPDRNGVFEALLMAKKKSDSGHYVTVVSFKIEAKQVTLPPLSYPQTWQIFYDLNLKVVAPRNRSTAVWAENASYAEVLMQAPNDVQLSCHIQHNNVKIENGSLAQFDNNKRLWQLLFAPEQTGPHELIIYAKRNNDSETPSSTAVKFNLFVTKLRRPMKFPHIYTQFQATKCQIYTPMDGVLKKGSVVPIHCVIPGAVDVNLTVDSKWLNSEGYTNPILDRQITVGSKEVIIYAKYGQKSCYDGLIRYTVE